MNHLSLSFAITINDATCGAQSHQAPTIVFGADVNHPGAGNVSKPSIAAVVASMDRWVARHGSCVAVQEHRKEVIQVSKNWFMSPPKAY